MLKMVKKSVPVLLIDGKGKNPGCSYQFYGTGIKSCAVKRRVTATSTGFGTVP
jgi:hypothetical protein